MVKILFFLGDGGWGQWWLESTPGTQEQVHDFLRSIRKHLHSLSAGYGILSQSFL